MALRLVEHASPPMDSWRVGPVVHGCVGGAMQKRFIKEVAAELPKRFSGIPISAAAA